MTSTTSLDDLVALGQHRWMAALIADLAAHHGARFVVLGNRLGVGRETLSRTLEATILVGWVMRNPGHGHPLRPEYILTEEGERLAGLAARQVAVQQRLGIAPGVLTRWGMPIIHSLDTGLSRFNDLSRALNPASPRALSQGLRALANHDLVARILIDTRPPASLYSLTDAGRVLARVS